MSPRKKQYRIPEWKVKQYKQKIKGILSGPYYCPKCDFKRLEIRIDKENNRVLVSCNCGLEHVLKYVSIYEPVDYYNKIKDDFFDIIT